MTNNLLNKIKLNKKKRNIIGEISSPIIYSPSVYGVDNIRLIRGVR